MTPVDPPGCPLGRGGGPIPRVRHRRGAGDDPMAVNLSPFLVADPGRSAEAAQRTALPGEQS